MEMIDDPWEPAVIRATTKQHRDLPSGKRLHNYGKSPFSMGTLTINDVHSGKRLHNYGKIHDAINW
jgi:hypothetical protein